MSFGRRLREARDRLRLTQEQFAELGGVKRVSQHLYEQDARVPDLNYLLRLKEHGIDVGHLVLGSEKIEVAARRGDVVLLLHAADASAEGRRKLDQAWRVGSEEEGSGRQGLVLPAPRTILSLALGRENVVHVAIVDRAAATRVTHALRRWRAFIGRDAALEAASAEAAGAPEMNLDEGI